MVSEMIRVVAGKCRHPGVEKRRHVALMDVGGGCLMDAGTSAAD